MEFAPPPYECLKFTPTEEEVFVKFLGPFITGELDMSRSLMLNDIDIYAHCPEHLGLDAFDIYSYYYPRNCWFLVNRVPKGTGKKASMEPKRVVGNGLGLWKTKGKPQNVMDGFGLTLLGTKQNLQFFYSNNSMKTGWLMTEYAPSVPSQRQGDLARAPVFQKRVVVNLYYKTNGDEIRFSGFDHPLPPTDGPDHDGEGEEDGQNQEGEDQGGGDQFNQRGNNGQRERVSGEFNQGGDQFTHGGEGQYNHQLNQHGNYGQRERVSGEFNQHETYSQGVLTTVSNQFNQGGDQFTHGGEGQYNHHGTYQADRTTFFNQPGTYGQFNQYGPYSGQFNRDGTAFFNQPPQQGVYNQYGTAFFYQPPQQDLQGDLGVFSDGYHISVLHQEQPDGVQAAADDDIFDFINFEEVDKDQEEVDQVVAGDRVQAAADDDIFDFINFEEVDKDQEEVDQVVAGDDGVDDGVEAERAGDDGVEAERAGDGVEAERAGDPERAQAAVDADLQAAVDADLQAAVDADLQAAVDADLQAAVDADLFNLDPFINKRR